MTFLKIINLSVDYKMRKETVNAAKNINIDIKKVIVGSKKLLKLKGKLIIEIGHKQKNQSIKMQLWESFPQITLLLVINLFRIL